MRLLGFQITRVKTQPASTNYLAPRGWYPLVKESFTGAWQRGKTVTVDFATSYSAVYSCVSLIAADIAKLRFYLAERDADGIWSETTSPAFSPVLRKPNHYQTRLNFFEHWVLSKLIHGNTYVLKKRDTRGVVVGLYILDPMRTKPMVTPSGEIWYELHQDNLSYVDSASIYVPATEIIHDRMAPLFHPLCGVSPLYAAGTAAMQGLSIQEEATHFFRNGARPSGILSAPGEIKEENIARLKQDWENNFSGANAGRVAVLGDGLKWEALTINAHDAQLIEQLKWTAETVCSVFHVPAFLAGVAPMPAVSDVQSMLMQYYSNCLQVHIESILECLDEGLGLFANKDGKTYGVEADLDYLLLMDTSKLVASLKEAVGAGVMKPNEARKKLGLKPVKGGDTPYLQQQNFSLAALADRDANDPFAKPLPPPPEPEKTVIIETTKETITQEPA